MTLGATMREVASTMLSDLGTTFVLVRHESNFDPESNRPIPNIAQSFTVKGSPPAELRSKDGTPLGILSTLVAAEGLDIEPDVRKDSIQWDGGEYRLQGSGIVMAQDTVVGYKLEFVL